MGQRMNWQKARKFKSAEEKWATGTVLESGRVVVNDTDTLEARAKAAEREWLRKNRLSKNLNKR